MKTILLKLLGDVFFQLRKLLFPKRLNNDEVKILLEQKKQLEGNSILELDNIFKEKIIELRFQNLHKINCPPRHIKFLENKIKANPELTWEKIRMLWKYVDTNSKRPKIKILFLDKIFTFWNLLGMTASISLFVFFLMRIDYVPNINWKIIFVKLIVLIVLLLMFYFCTVELLKYITAKRFRKKFNYKNRVN